MNKKEIMAQLIERGKYSAPYNYTIFQHDCFDVNIRAGCFRIEPNYVIHLYPVPGGDELFPITKDEYLMLKKLFNHVAPCSINDNSNSFLFKMTMCIGAFAVLVWLLLILDLLNVICI